VGVGRQRGGGPGDRRVGCVKTSALFRLLRRAEDCREMVVEDYDSVPGDADATRHDRACVGSSMYRGIKED
jgi:hypothetical protein